MYGVWAEMLNDCRNNLGPAPRTFSMWDRMNYLRISKPGWMKKDKSDRLNELLDQRNEIVANGEVIWAHIVQANSLLFEKGNDNCPAAVIYSPNSQMQMDPTLLEDVSRRMFELKGDSAQHDKDKALIGRLLADESGRPMGVSVPRSICSIGELIMSCTFIARQHFPLRCLRGGIFPVLIHSQDSSLVLPLPERYWSRRLVEWWSKD